MAISPRANRKDRPMSANRTPGSKSKLKPLPPVRTRTALIGAVVPDSSASPLRRAPQIDGPLGKLEVALNDSVGANSDSPAARRASTLAPSVLSPPPSAKFHNRTNFVIDTDLAVGDGGKLSGTPGEDGVPTLGLKRAANEHREAEMEYRQARNDIQWKDVLKKAAAENKRQYRDKSFCVWTPDSKFRSAVIQLTQWSWFDKFVLLMIVANCAFLAALDPVCDALLSNASGVTEILYPSEDCDSFRRTRDVLALMEVVFTVIFAVEMGLKMVAKGVWFHQEAYLRDGWNWLDFIVVIVSVAGLAPGVGNFTMIRTVRVLRPLRTMTRFPGMSALISTTVRSLKPLANVILVCFFVFFVFAILGMDTFAGTLRGRCFYTKDGIAEMGNQQVADEIVGGVSPICMQPGLFGEGKECPLHSECRTHNPETGDLNPNPQELISFDNVGEALLTIFQVTTLEGWSLILAQYEEGREPWTSRFFFTLMICIGGFYSINLALAVITHRFSLSSNAELLKQLALAAGGQAVDLDGDGRDDDDESEMDKIQQLMDRKSVILPAALDNSLPTAAVGASGVGDDWRTPSMLSTWSRKMFSKMNLEQEGGIKRTGFKLRAYNIVSSSYFDSLMVTIILVNTIVLALESHDNAFYEDSVCRALSDGRCIGPLFTRTHNFQDEISTGSIKTMDPQAVNDAIEWTSTMVGCVEIDSGERCFPDKSLDWWKEQSLTQVCERKGRCRGMPQTTATNLDRANAVLSVLFILEMVLKIYGLTFKVYMSSRANVFDALIVVASLIELLYNAFDSSQGSGGSMITTLRAFRLARIFMLARRWSSLRLILAAMVEASKTLGPLVSVLLMFMYMASLFGMQFFGGRFKDSRFESEGVPKSNFDSFLPSDRGNGAMMTVFQVVTAENWHLVLYSAVTVSRWSPLFFVTIIVIGNYLLMNLFLAIFVYSFWKVHYMDKYNAKSEARVTKWQTAKNLFSQVSTHISATSNRIHSEIEEDVGVGIDNTPKVQTAIEEGLEMMMRSTVLNSDFLEKAPGASDRDPDDSLKSSISTDVGGAADTRTVKSSVSFQVPDGTRDQRPRRGQLTRQRSVKQQVVRPTIRFLAWVVNSITKRLNRQNSLGLFGPEGGWPALHGLQKLATKISSSKKTDHFILALIVGSSICLIIENPMDQILCDRCESKSCRICVQNDILAVLNLIFVAVFTVECTLKILARGFIMQKNAYLRSGWNILDGLVVSTSLAGTISASSLRHLRVLRTLRALRPLRVLQRNNTMRVAVISVLRCIPSVFNIALVCFLFFSIFGTLGVQLFKGAFGACITANGQEEMTHFPEEPTREVVDIISCSAAGGVWRTPIGGFDSFPNALLAMFEMATIDGWIFVLGLGMDAVGPGIVMRSNYNHAVAPLFVLSLMVIAMFIFSLFIGVVVDNFNQTKTELTTPIMLGKVQREFVAACKVALSTVPKAPIIAPQNKLSKFLFGVVTHQRFEYLVTFMIFANLAILASNTYDQPNATTMALETCNFVFTLCFVLEATAKMTAMGVRLYIRDSWNLFDMIVVLITLVNSIVDRIGGISVKGLSVLRAFRVIRLFRLAKQLRQLRQILEALVQSLSSLVNVTCLLMLFFVIYAVLGVNFFWNVRWHQTQYSWISEKTNFSTFGLAMISLFRVITGEGWHGIMHDCMNQDPIEGCRDPTIQEGCGDPTTAVAFFVTFKLFGAFILLNLFVAFIMESFERAVSEKHQIIPKDDLMQFCKVWSSMEGANTSELLPCELVPQLLRELPPSIGLSGSRRARAVLIYMKGVVVPVYDGKVFYLDVFLSLIRRNVVAVVPPQHKIHSMLTQIVAQRKDKILKANNITRGVVRERLVHDWAARVLQRAYRRGCFILSPEQLALAGTMLVTPKNSSVPASPVGWPVGSGPVSGHPLSMFDQLPAKAFAGEGDVIGTHDGNAIITNGAHDLNSRTGIVQPPVPGVVVPALTDARDAKTERPHSKKKLQPLPPLSPDGRYNLK